MIDEADDCAYVIGNNVRHSGQFQKCQILHQILILLPYNFNSNRFWLAINHTGNQRPSAFSSKRWLAKTGVM